MYNMSIRGLQKSAAPVTYTQVIRRVMRWETYTRSVLMRTRRAPPLYVYT